MRTKRVNVIFLSALWVAFSMYFVQQATAQTVLQGRINVTGERQIEVNDRAARPRVDPEPVLNGQIDDGDRNSFPSFTFTDNKNLDNCTKVVEVSWIPGAIPMSIAKDVATPHFFQRLHALSKEVADSWTDIDGSGFATFDIVVGEKGLKEFQQLHGSNRRLTAGAGKTLRAKAEKFACPAPIEIRLHYVFSERP